MLDPDLLAWHPDILHDKPLMAGLLETRRIIEPAAAELAAARATTEDFDTIAASLDAMAVGVSLAFLQVNIFVIALCIGAATMVMSSTGILAGRFLGQRFGRAAETIGGFVLCGLGAYILFEHLTVA